MKNNHSITNTILHFVFVTKFRHTLGMTDHMLMVLEGISNELNSPVQSINCAGNHFHILVDLHPSISVSEYACKMKSISSGIFGKLYKDWNGFQTGYFECSVGSESISKVKSYILYQ